MVQQGCHSENIKKEEIAHELKSLAFHKKIMYLSVAYPDFRRWAIAIDK